MNRREFDDTLKHLIRCGDVVVVVDENHEMRLYPADVLPEMQESRQLSVSEALALIDEFPRDSKLV